MRGEDRSRSACVGTRFADRRPVRVMMPPGGRRQSAAMRIGKGAALVATALLGAAAVAQVLAVADAAAAPSIAAGVLLGYLAADLCSGTVHWFCDTFFEEDTPVIGRRVIWPFRDHHRDPLAIVRYRLLEQDGTSYVAVMAPLALAVFSGGPGTSGSLGFVLHAAVCAFAVGTAGTNLFHKWAHMPDPPAAIAWLQKRRLILSPERHALHHRTHDRSYCVTSGWLNPLLDRSRLFAAVERVVRRCQRSHPGSRA